MTTGDIGAFIFKSEPFCTSNLIQGYQGPSNWYQGDATTPSTPFPSTNEALATENLPKFKIYANEYMEYPFATNLNFRWSEVQIQDRIAL